MITLPIHFKLPGRSYSQIGRKGNIALYAVYSDYIEDRFTSLPYVLLGFELIVIKIKNGREIYPSAWQFGSHAWSIPKSIARVCAACFGRRVSGRHQLQFRLPISVPDRSATSAQRAHLPQDSAPTDKKAFQSQTPRR